MTIHITPEKIIRDIQHDFHEAYPFLKIDFFLKGKWYDQADRKKHNVSNSQAIGSKYKVGPESELWITPDMTVFDLEKKCEDLFGLSIQIYRRSGKVWLETTMTYKWTMKQQNDHGCELTKVIS